MITAIVDAIVAALRAIPIIDSWFKKSELDRELADKKKVDQEHDKNRETRRPKDDFWSDRGM